jgi:hypothetical protein
VRENLRWFRARLDNEKYPETRDMPARLTAEEEAKLEGLERPEQEQRSSQPGKP